MTDELVAEKEPAWSRYLPTVRAPDPELVADLLEHVAHGRTIRSWLRKNPHVHSLAVSYWRRSRPDIGAAIDAAREAGNDRLMEECIEIADTDGVVDRAKLRVDTRMRVLSKTDDRFAEKSGAAPQAVANVQIVTGVPPRKPAILATDVVAHTNGRNG